MLPALQTPEYQGVFESKPLLIVISGPTAVGKDAVINLIFDKRTPLHFVVTATDRAPRPGEMDGKDYLFLSKERFQEMVDNDEFAEHAWVYDHNKGIPRAQIEPALKSGEDVILRVDVQGARKLRELYPDCIQIFLVTKNEEELRQRIIARKTETEKQIELRMETARKELEQIPLFDYVVLNTKDKLGETVETILAIIRAEHRRVARLKSQL